MEWYNTIVFYSFVCYALIYLSNFRNRAYSQRPSQLGLCSAWTSRPSNNCGYTRWNIQSLHLWRLLLLLLLLYGWCGWKILQLDSVTIFPLIHCYQVTRYSNWATFNYIYYITLWNWLTCCYSLFGEYRIGGSRQCRRWHHHAVYLRCIQGFLQSAPQLILQTLILFKVCYIRANSSI